MVLVRGVVFLITGGAPVGDDGLPPSLHRLRLRAPARHPLSGLGAGHPARRAVLGDARDALRPAHLRHRRQPRGGLSVRRAGASASIASTYVWCGALAGVAGVMLAARLQSGQPTAGEFYELTAIAAVVLGGAALHGGEGTLYKSVIGVFIMIVLGNSLNLLNVDSYWQRVAVGAVIIAAAAADRLRSRSVNTRRFCHVEASSCRVGRGAGAAGRAGARARRGAAEDHHRRLARAGRQPVLHRHAARHPRARPGARLGGGDGLGQRGQGQADQRRAGPGGARRQGHSDFADRRGRRERRL